MEPRGCLFVCLCVCLSLGYGVFGNNPQRSAVHGSMCRPNERFLPCGGCQKTCADPVPNCEAVCKTGCYCNEDEVRNETGDCVKLADCPSVSPAKLQSSEPRLTDFDCPSNEEYRSCEPCNRTCENPNPMCPAQCARGCFCVDDLVRDKDGRCVPVKSCSNVKKNESSNYLKPIPMAYQLTCGPHQVYNSCRSCERMCSSPTPVCTSTCSAGCFCQDGFVKGPDGQCVKLEDCPQAEISYANVQEPTIEDCSSDEIYLSCGWCEPSCWEPKPECPVGVCTRGCLCRPPLLRHHSGHCVHEMNCSPQKCSNPNEEFVCRYGCEARCDAKKCFPRPRKCVLGCHCKLGLYRDIYGNCVSLNQCPNYNSNATSNNKTVSNDSKSLDTPSFLIKVNQDIAQDEDLKSVFGPIPDEHGNYHSSAPERKDSTSSLFHDGNLNPYRDAISRAVKLYKEFLGNANSRNTYSSNFYIPTFKRQMYRDGLVTKGPKSIKSNDDIGKSQFYVNQDTKPPEDANVKNYMNHLITVMREMMPPQPRNLTLKNGEQHYY